MKRSCISLRMITVCTAFCLSVLTQAAGQGTPLRERFISSAGIHVSSIEAKRSYSPLLGANAEATLNIFKVYSDFSTSLASLPGISYHPRTYLDTSSYIAFSFPALFQFNIGHLSSHDFYSSLGFFAGIGSGFCIIDGRFDRGMLLTTGLRFWLLNRSFTLRYSYTDLQNNFKSIHITSLQLNLGAYLSKVQRNNKITKFVKPFSGNK